MTLQQFLTLCEKHKNGEFAAKLRRVLLGKRAEFEFFQYTQLVLINNSDSRTRITTPTINNLVGAYLLKILLPEMPEMQQKIGPSNSPDSFDENGKFEFTGLTEKIFFLAAVYEKQCDPNNNLGLISNLPGLYLNTSFRKGYAAFEKYWAVFKQFNTSLYEKQYLNSLNYAQCTAAIAVLATIDDADFINISDNVLNVHRSLKVRIGELLSERLKLLEQLAIVDPMGVFNSQSTPLLPPYSWSFPATVPRLEQDPTLNQLMHCLETQLRLTALPQPLIQKACLIMKKAFYGKFLAAGLSNQEGERVDAANAETVVAQLIEMLCGDAQSVLSDRRGGTRNKTVDKYLNTDEQSQLITALKTVFNIIGAPFADPCLKGLDQGIAAREVKRLEEKNLLLLKISHVRAVLTKLQNAAPIITSWLPISSSSTSPPAPQYTYYIEVNLVELDAIRPILQDMKKKPLNIMYKHFKSDGPPPTNILSIIGAPANFGALITQQEVALNEAFDKVQTEVQAMEEKKYKI
jgi:hypothetical protein